jgi:hypothetical protein
MKKFDVQYKVNEWRLFIEYPKRSFKPVRLHIGNNYASLPVGHSVHLKVSYENFELVLTKIGYTAHDWLICGDLKVLCMFVPSTHVACVNGTAEQEVNTGSKSIGHLGHHLNLEANTFCA